MRAPFLCALDGPRIARGRPHPRLYPGTRGAPGQPDASRVITGKGGHHAARHRLRHHPYRRGRCRSGQLPGDQFLHRQWRHPGLVSVPDRLTWRRAPVWAGCGVLPGRPRLELLRSFKRQLATRGPAAAIPLGTGTVTALELLTAFLAQLRRDLVARSNLRLRPQEPLEAVVAVPAN